MSEEQSYVERCKDARLTKPGDIWTHRKTGKTLEILERVGYHDVLVKHESGNITTKQDHYLAGDYFLSGNKGMQP